MSPRTNCEKTIKKTGHFGPVLTILYSLVKSLLKKGKKIILLAVSKVFVGHLAVFKDHNGRDA